MQLQFKYLTVCTLSIMLIACGGGSSSEGGASNTVRKVDNSCENYKLQLPITHDYVEPSNDVVDASVLGFNDCESNGQLRLIRNDLSGNFNAMILPSLRLAASLNTLKPLFFNLAVKSTNFKFSKRKSGLSDP